MKNIKKFNSKSIFFLIVLVLLFLALAIFQKMFRASDISKTDYRQDDLGFAVALSNIDEKGMVTDEYIENGWRKIGFYWQKNDPRNEIFQILIYAENAAPKEIGNPEEFKILNSTNGNTYICHLLAPDTESDQSVNDLRNKGFDNCNDFKLTGQYVHRSADVYFSRSSDDCSLVSPLQRVLDYHPSYEREALKQLLLGPTPEEKAQGYTSPFSDATANLLKGFKIKDKVAYLNFVDFRQLLPNSNSSCGSSQLISQIEYTLKQFESIDRVILAIDGQPQLLYDWLQYGCNKKNNNCKNDEFININ